MSATTPPEIWISSCSLSFILLVLNTRLVSKEYKRRRAGNITFTTKYIVLWSILCMILGPTCLLVITLKQIPGFCYISLVIFRLTLYAQPIILGLYQLSRLHYCFAREKVYSNKGYPNWLFLIMFGYAIILYSGISFFSIDHYVVSCGINNRYQAYENYKYLMHKNSYPFAIAICTVMYIIWDVTTLMLYIYKIRMFTKSKQGTDDKVKHRILSILNKITIITLFYQFVAILLTLAWYLLVYTNHRLIACIPTYFSPLLYTYSMYIMLDHNKNSYKWFLKILYGFRLYFVCYCCCNKRITQQWNDVRSMDLSLADNSGDNCPQIDNTIYDTKTHDILANNVQIRFQALSIETTINES